MECCWQGERESCTSKERAVVYIGYNILWLIHIIWVVVVHKFNIVSTVEKLDLISLLMMVQSQYTLLWVHHDIWLDHYL